LDIFSSTIQTAVTSKDERETYMNSALKPELFWLVLASMMTALIFVPHILNRMKEHGIWPAIYNLQPVGASRSSRFAVAHYTARFFPATCAA